MMSTASSAAAARLATHLHGTVNKPGWTTIRFGQKQVFQITPLPAIVEGCKCTSQVTGAARHATRHCIPCIREPLAPGRTLLTILNHLWELKHPCVWSGSLRASVSAAAVASFTNLPMISGNWMIGGCSPQASDSPEKAPANLHTTLRCGHSQERHQVKRMVLGVSRTSCLHCCLAVG